MQLIQQLRRFYRQRFNDWIDKRLVPARNIRLNNRKLFIFPSRAGFGFLLLVLLIWLVGTNYENNLILALAYGLVALFIVTILHTFNNLSGLELEYISSTPVFSGEEAEVELQLSRGPKQSFENIQLGYVGATQVTADLIENDQARVKVFVRTLHRGWFNPGRLLVETRYPFGLIRCWTWLDLDVRILVYPKPLAAAILPLATVTGNDGEQQHATGGDDFAGLRDYRPGESLKQIAWKQYARAGQLYTKEYASLRDQQLWLDWDAFAGMDREARLSRLCFWVQEVSKTEQYFGLRLPAIEVAPNSGFEHKKHLLKTLALFEWQQAAISANRQRRSL